MNCLNIATQMLANWSTELAQVDVQYIERMHTWPYEDRSRRLESWI